MHLIRFENAASIGVSEENLTLLMDGPTDLLLAERLRHQACGGAAATAHYDMTSDGDTGHAESVRIAFDPARISYGKLLQIYFSVAHDPTQLNRQGPDVGTSYRSAIFYSNEQQHKIAEAYIHQLDAAHAFPAKIVTEVTPLKGFYKGEEYHQDYATKNPNNPYIQICDVPKTKALIAQFPELFVEYKLH